MSEIRDMHEPLAAWLRSNGVLFRHSRTDCRTSEPNGEPDFLIMENNRVLPIELKTEKGKLSTKQVFRHAEYAKAGCRVFVVRELSAAIELVQAWRTQAPEPLLTESANQRLTRIGNALCVERIAGVFEKVRNA